MALLGDIRKKSGLLAVVIGGALLLFLLSEIFSNQNFGIFGGGDNNNPTVLEVDGKKIDRMQFDRIVSQSERVRELNGMQVDDNMRRQLRTEAANQLFNDMAIEPILKNLGIDISGKEYGELLTGDDPHPFIKQYFQQQYNPEVMRRFLQNEYQQDPKYKAAMDEILRAIKTQVKAEKYNNMVRAGFQATPFDIEISYTKQETKVSGQIIFANYLSVADSMVDVSDRELNNYIQNHKEEFEVDASRDIEYVEWNISPSAADSTKAAEQVTRLLKAFKETEDDSSFIAKNSDLPYNPVYRSHGSFGGEAETKLFDASVGEVVGPIAGEGGFGLYKILGTQEGSKVFYNFSQIVLSMSTDTAAVYSKARQLVADINNGASFEELAGRNSVDPSSANGGNMGWIGEVAFIPKAVYNYNNNNQQGSIGIVRGPTGLHIIRVNRKPSKKMIRVASVTRKLDVSRQTRNAVFGIANNFVAEVDNKDDLGFANKAASINKNVKNASKLAPGAQGWATIPNARDVVKWSFDDKRVEGDISEPFTIGNKIIVARVRKIVNKGVSELESVRDEVRLKVINKKKAKILNERFAEAIQKQDDKNDPVALAIAMGTVAQKIENAQFNQNNMLYVGSDYAVQGALLGIKKGEHTKPISGDQGVYVFYCNDVSTPPTAPNMDDQIAKITSSYRQGIESKIDEVLKDQAGLENMFDKYY
jgi:peptidyl-prolyl cis-trans isomerase D